MSSREPVRMLSFTCLFSKEVMSTNISWYVSSMHCLLWLLLSSYRYNCCY